MSIPPGSREPFPDESPTVRLPVAPPRPTAAYPVDDPYRDDRGYRDGHDDTRYDDTRYDGHDGYGYDDRPEPVGDRRELPRRERPRGPRRRGQIFSLLVLLAAAGTAYLLGSLVNAVIAGIDLTAEDPFGAAGTSLVTLGIVAVVAVVVLVLAFVAVVIARPRLLAFLAMLAAVLLPVAAVVIGVWTGTDALRQRVAGTVDAAGSSVGDVVRELEERGIDIGPLRDLLPE